MVDQLFKQEQLKAGVIGPPTVGQVGRVRRMVANLDLSLEDRAELIRMLGLDKPAQHLYVQADES